MLTLVKKLNRLLYYQNSIFFQLQGGFAPLTPDQGLCHWTPLGALPPDPRYRLALRARHVVPRCLEEIAATVRYCTVCSGTRLSTPVRNEA